MNKYVILEKQEEKVIKLEKERSILFNDIVKANSSEELDVTEKRIQSLKRKVNYLWNKIEDNYEKGLGPNATMKVVDLFERLERLVRLKKHSQKTSKENKE